MLPDPLSGDYDRHLNTNGSSLGDHGVAEHNVLCSVRIMSRHVSKFVVVCPVLGVLPQGCLGVAVALGTPIQAKVHGTVVPGFLGRAPLPWSWKGVWDWKFKSSSSLMLFARTKYRVEGDSVHRFWHN